MKHKDLDEYDKNSVDISRIRSVIKNGCTCQARCTADFDPLSIQRVCTAYCSLEHGERQFFLHTLYHSDSEGLRDTSAPSCDMEATARKTRWHLLGQKVCVKGFAALLGMAPRTLYKQVSQALDMRRAIGDAGRLAERRDAPQRQICHTFFQNLYLSAAEPLPQGQPVKFNDDSDDECDGLAQWTADKTLMDLATELCGSFTAGVPMREMPFSNLNDVYFVFLASCETSGIHEKAPSRFTFARAWHENWYKVLKFRFQSSHMQCQTCFELSQHTYNVWQAFADKLAWARLWKKHLREQYEDRTVYWSLRAASREFDSTILTIIIDSMDNKKCAWPRYNYKKRPHEVEQLKPRPRTVVTCGIAHGWVTAFFLTEENLSHGSNAFIDVLVQLLSKVCEMCKVQGRRFPVHLAVQADNTTGQTKNQFVAAFIAYIVGKNKVSTAVMNFLMVGHTHEDVDHWFGIITDLLVRKHLWDTPDEFARLLTQELSKYVEARGEVMMVRRLHSIRDFNSWLAPAGVEPYGCWGSRDGIEAPHSFTFKRRTDLRLEEQSQVNTTKAEAIAKIRPHGSDVFCCIKTYMRDRRLQQTPIMIMPKSRQDFIDGSYPISIQASNLTRARATQLENLAVFYERDLYSRPKTARALRELARDDQSQIVSPGMASHNIIVATLHTQTNCKILSNNIMARLYLPQNQMYTATKSGVLWCLQ